MKELDISPATRHAIKEISGPRALLGLSCYLHAFAWIAAAIALGHLVPRPAVILLSIVLIAARQHSLYVLNHDASHATLFAGKRMNKRVSTWLSNLIFFHHPEAYSYVQWRRVHRLHHAYLFTEQDPNYVERQLNGEDRFPFTGRRLLLELLKAGPRAVRSFFVGRQDYVWPDGVTCQKRRFNHLATLFVPFENDPEMERERYLKIGFFAAALLVIHLLGLWRPFALFWVLPMYSIYPAVLRLMDLTEHRWEIASSRVLDNTVSTRPNRLEHWLISDLNRSLHREHHLFPTVPGAYLPRLSDLLVGAGHLDPPRTSFFT